MVFIGTTPRELDEMNASVALRNSPMRKERYSIGIPFCRAMVRITFRVTPDNIFLAAVINFWSFMK
jgi:hypothetical protein